MTPISFADNYKNKSPTFQFLQIIKSGLFIFWKWIRTKNKKYHFSWDRFSNSNDENDLKY